MVALLGVPRWGFHLAVTALAGWLLWSASFPGSDFFSATAAGFGLCLAAVVWLVKLVLSVRRRSLSWWFAVAPIGALAVVALLAVDAPLQARWELSRPAFEAAVQDPAPDVGSRIGLYEIISVEPIPGGVLFYEAHGAFLDDAGFAYLPGGPTPELENGGFESPRYHHLGGPWYAFTASW